MKIRLKTLLLFWFGLIFCAVHGQVIDSTQTAVVFQQTDTTGQVAGEGSYEEYDDIPFEAGFAVMVMIGTAFLLGCMGAGALVTAMLLAALFGLAGLGIVSTSVFIGLHRKSFETGFRTFVLLLSCLCGVLFGSVVCTVLNQLLHWVTFNTALLTGAGLGFFAGLVMGQVNFIVMKRLTLYFKDRLSIVR